MPAASAAKSMLGQTNQRIAQLLATVPAFLFGKYAGFGHHHCDNSRCVLRIQKFYSMGQTTGRFLKVPLNHPPSV